MKNNPLVSVLIVNWNGVKWLDKCLKSLYNQTYKKFEIIIIDNASTDQSIRFIRKKFPEITIIKNNENFGFGVANNYGAKKAKGSVLFFLNNDVITPPELLESMIRFKLKKRLNMVNPKILDQNGHDINREDYLGIDFLGSPGGPSKKVFFLDGCALMIGKKDFFKLGQFDQKYFMYSEDIDLCWRGHLYGMKLGICEMTSLIHFGGGSSESTQYTKHTRHTTSIIRRYEVEKNNLRNLIKNLRFVNLLWVVPIFFLQDFLESLVYLFTGNFQMFCTIWKALFWNLYNIGDTIYQRKKIQANRTVGDVKILSMMNFNIYKLKNLLAIGWPKFK